MILAAILAVPIAFALGNPVEYREVPDFIPPNWATVQRRVNETSLSWSWFKVACFNEGKLIWTPGDTLELVYGDTTYRAVEEWGVTPMVAGLNKVRLGGPMPELHRVVFPGKGMSTQLWVAFPRIEKFSRKYVSEVRIAHPLRSTPARAEPAGVVR